MDSHLMPDFGVCPCGGQYNVKLVDIRFTANPSMQRELLDMPQGECPRCGSRVYTLADMQRIESVMRSISSPPTTA